MFYLLIRRGVKDAAALNRIVTIAKVVPILVFVVLALFYLDPQVFADNWSGNQDDVGTLFDQVRGTMLVTVFVFLGWRAPASTPGTPTPRGRRPGHVLGFLMVFSVFASVTIVSYGILPYEEIADLRQPSMAGVLEAAVGQWGQVFVSIGLIVSVLGAYLAWTLMAAEVLFVAAKDEDMPRFLGRSNEDDVPGAGAADDHRAGPGHARGHAVLGRRVQLRARPDQRAHADPVPAGGGVRAEAGRDPGDLRRRAARLRRELVVAVVATLYIAFLLYAAGPKFILVSFIIYAPATVLFVMARREQGRQLFSPKELVILVVSIAGAVAGVVALAAGWITV